MGRGAGFARARRGLLLGAALVVVLVAVTTPGTAAVPMPQVSKADQPTSAVAVNMMNEDDKGKGKLDKSSPLELVGLKEPEPKVPVPQSTSKETKQTPESGKLIVTPIKEDKSTLFPFSKGLTEKALLIAVMTAPGHAKARNSLRDVFDMYSSSGIVFSQDLRGIDLKFFIGQIDPTKPDSRELEASLVNEQQQHHDIVRLPDFFESYFNLTRKTVGIVTWAKESGYANIWKMDDDSFLRLENLVQFLKAEMRPQYIYAGAFVTGNWVIDNPDSKWYNRDLYDHDFYPDYASGPGYFLGSKVVDFLYENRKQLVMYRVEDAAVGIWTEEMPQIDRVNLSVEAYSAECEDTPEVVYVNPINTDEMRVLMQNVLHGNMCLGGFISAECTARPCLCHPMPEACEFNPGTNWSEFSNDQYHDLIPRLVQTEAKTVVPPKQPTFRARF